MLMRAWDDVELVHTAGTASHTPVLSNISVVHTHIDSIYAHNVYSPYFHYGESNGDDPGSCARTHDAARMRNVAHEHGVWEKYCKIYLRYETSILITHMLYPPILGVGNATKLVLLIGL